VELPGPVPLHREPLFSAAPDLVAKYPTHDDKKVLLAPADAVQDGAGQANATVHEQYPLIMTSGRLVEYEGGGDETRSNPWLAELQQDMFVEINPKDANDRGIATTSWSG
jgi:formate dehydrogenase major subunit